MNKMRLYYNSKEEGEGKGYPLRKHFIFLKESNSHRFSKKILVLAYSKLDFPVLSDKRGKCFTGLFFCEALGR